MCFSMTQQRRLAVVMGQKTHGTSNNYQSGYQVKELATKNLN